MTQHTAGPWTCETLPERWGEYFIPEAAKHISSDFDESFAKQEEIDKANARLIAAAPELLEALKIAEVHLGWGDVTLGNVHRIVRNAIAKATGTQP